MKALTAALLLASTPAPQPAPAAAAAPALKPLPTDAECLKLPAMRQPLAFGSGEELEFDVDAMGANAGKLYFRVLPLKEGALPIEVTAKTNTLFEKIRRVSGGGMSYLNPHDLHPVRYYEDTTENEVRKIADVKFVPRERKVHVDWQYGDKHGNGEYRYGNDGLDLAGAVYLMRQLPLEANKRICFDVYAMRQLWRMDGAIEAREHVSLPLGEFEAWHLHGTAIRVDRPNVRREVHVWISDDKRRLPLAAVGAIDLGAVRATLSAFHRPGDKSERAQGKESLKW